MHGSADSFSAARAGVLVALGALGMASIALACWSLTAGGVGWDTRGDTLKAGIARSLSTDTTLADAYEAIPGDNEFYGLLVHQLADVIRFAVTGDWPTPRPDDATTYRFQGIATLLLGVLGVTGLGAAVAFAFRSLLAGLLAWSLTLATPLWLGMSHVDFKDIPVAAGVSLVSAGLLAVIVDRVPVAIFVAGCASAALGGAIAVGTRAGAIVLVGALVGGTSAVCGLARWRSRIETRVLARALAVSGTAIGGALAFVWATNPLAQIDLIRWLVDSVDSASRFPWTGVVRTAGRDLAATDLPWGYLPAWYAAQLPLLTTVCIVAAAAFLARSVLRWPRHRESTPSLPVLPLTPLLIQALVLPAAMVVSGAVLYDATRHVLFVLPALFALVGVGAGQRVAELDTARRFGRAFGVSLAALAAVAASFAASVRWAPYAYAHVNPAAARIDEGRGWELDFWGVTGREGFRRLRGFGIADIAVAPADRAAWAWYEPPTAQQRGAGQYVFIRGSITPHAACRELFRIKRGGLTLGIGSRCPAGVLTPAIPPTTENAGG